MKTRLDKIPGFNKVTRRKGKKYTRYYKNMYLSNVKPCYENMHGTTIISNPKGCAWYRNGKKVSSDRRYISENDNYNYIWKSN
jgi:hypothetical protein